MRYELGRTVTLIMRGYLCEYCGAEPGEKCMSRRGYVSIEHNSRYKQAVSDGKLPISLDEVYA